MTTDHPNLEAARDAALGALRSLAARRDRLPSERAELMAVAWHCGERNVAGLARTADVSRETVYSDLRSQGIDPTDRKTPVMPRFRPLDRASVRQAADIAGGVLGSAMLARNPRPLAEAAWQAHLALHRVADLTDTGPNDDENRPGYIRDLARRGDAVRRHAHRMLADELPDDQVAARTRADLDGAYAHDRPVITGMTLDVELPNEQRITVVISPSTNTDRIPGWTGWFTRNGVALSRPGAYEHLEVRVAVTALADALAQALPEHASRPQLDPTSNQP